MNRCSPLWAILFVVLVSSGCGFFKRDIKTTNEALEDGGVAFDQEQSVPNAGPSEGMVALEQATEGNTSPIGQDSRLKSSNAPLPPREPEQVAQASPKTPEPHADPWAEPGQNKGGYASPDPSIDSIVGAAPITGPSIPPQPEGKPVTSANTSFKEIPDFRPDTSTGPITQTKPFGNESIVGSAIDENPLLADSGNAFGSTLRSDMNQSFGSPGYQSLELNAQPPGIQGQSLADAAQKLSQSEAAATQGGMDLARAVHPSGLGEGQEDQYTPAPQPGFQPLRSDSLEDTTLLGNKPTIDAMGASLKSANNQVQGGFQPLPPSASPPAQPHTGLVAPTPEKSTETAGTGNRPARNDFGPSATEIPAPRKSPAPQQDKSILLSQTGGTNNPVASQGEGNKPAGQTQNEKLPDADALKDLGVKQYKASRFDDSIGTFRKYLGAYPDENQEVQWRLAQALFQSNRWGEAETEFDKLRGSPRAEFRADAILKLGLIDQIRGDKEGARQHWSNVVDNYPKTDAATRASKLLAETP